MDFAAIGESMAMARAISNARAAAEASDAEVGKANVIIRRQADEIATLRRKLASVQQQFHVQIAHTEGVVMQAREMRAALTAIVPSHPLLRMTGKRYDDTPQLECHKTFELHFDLKAEELGLPKPYSDHRPMAR